MARQHTPGTLNACPNAREADNSLKTISNSKIKNGISKICEAYEILKKTFWI
jgi:hypothetical protein